MTEPYVAVIFVLLTLVSLVIGNIISIYLWPWVKRHPRLFQFSFPPLVMSIATFTWAQANYRGIDKIPNWLLWACLAALALPCLVWAIVLLWDLWDRSGVSVEGVPRPPNKFLAHRYTLATTKNKKLIGR